MTLRLSLPRFALGGLAVFALLIASGGTQPASASQLIIERNMDVSRGNATQKPRSVGDQAIANGWPLYRTDRGQESFNHAMATIAVTEGRAPSAQTFAGCTDLVCKLDLPRVGKDAWVPAGRYWTSPNDYVIIAHSPRNGSKSGHRRRGSRTMKYFIFHEFHNSTRNVDPYDTISSHRRSVFVPFYMGKTRLDAQGRRFVVIVQVAPYDVISRHARNFGSAGPGIEIAKNYSDKLEPMQSYAGTLLATMLKRAYPKLKMVRHRGKEGLASLRAYERRLSALRKVSQPRTLRIPFVPVEVSRKRTAAVPLKALLSPGDAPTRVVMATPDADATQAVAAAPQDVAPTAVAAMRVPIPIILGRGQVPTGGAMPKPVAVASLDNNNIGIPEPVAEGSSPPLTMAGLIRRTAPSFGRVETIAQLSNVMTWSDEPPIATDVYGPPPPALGTNAHLTLTGPPRRVTQRRCGLMRVFYPDIVCRGS